MTTEKPDPAALLPCPFCGAPAHIEDGPTPMCGYKIHASCGPDCRVQPSVWAEYAPEAIAAWNTRAALTPQSPTHMADDAAVLEDMVNELTGAAEEQFRLKQNTMRYRKARAAVLARMSTPPGYKLVPVEPDLTMCNRGFNQIDPMMENDRGIPLARRVYRAMLAAAPTEVK